MTKIDLYIYRVRRTHLQHYIEDHIIGQIQTITIYFEEFLRGIIKHFHQIKHYQQYRNSLVCAFCVCCVPKSYETRLVWGGGGGGGGSKSLIY